jgi:NAD(P)-dependent dehydrogenase (short-subunit alcohol dehydrogenase family)
MGQRPLGWPAPDLSAAVAVVTGATRGVGRGVAEALGDCGATVWVTGRSTRGGAATEGLPGTVEETAEAVEARGGVGIPTRCDHTIDSEVEELFARVGERHGRVDLLVNNVWGGYEHYDAAEFNAPFWEQPLERWQAMFDAGVRARFVASRLAAPLLLRARRGLVVNTSFGLGGKYLGSLLYDVAKNAVDRLAFAMAEELRPYGVAAVSLHPGFVRTERNVAYYGEPLADKQSPELTGRVIAALAADPELLGRSGRVFTVEELAAEYGLEDVPALEPERSVP